MIDAEYAFLYDDIDDFAPAVAGAAEDDAPDDAAAGNSGGDAGGAGEDEDDFYNPDEMDEAPEDDGIIVCGTHPFSFCNHTPR